MSYKSVHQGIRIHPPSSGRQTDHDLAARIQGTYPETAAAATYVLAAAKHVLEHLGERPKWGIWGGEPAYRDELERKMQIFIKRAEKEGALRDSRSQSIESALRDFWSLFSDAYPNWQAEYELVDQWITRHEVGLIVARNHSR